MFSSCKIWKKLIKKDFRCTLDKKIGGLATVLLILMGGVSSYFYFEVNEISREIEEIGQSDLPIYKTTTELILCQKEKLLLLEQLDYIYHSSSSSLQDQSRYFSEIAYKFDRVEQNINRTLLTGIQQSQSAFQKEIDKEDKIRLNQDREDYQQLENIFLKLEVENQKFNLILEQFLEKAIIQQTSPSASSIQEARLKLKVFDQLIQEIVQRLEDHINGSISATTEERSLAVKTNALIALGALLFGSFVSTMMIREITSSVKKVTKQAKFIANNIHQEGLVVDSLVIDTSDEIEDLSVAFNRMVENFLSSQAERKQIAEKLSAKKNLAQWQANHDVLTGLANRRKFESQLNKIWSSNSQKTHSLIYLDLDNFKIVNDTCGHIVGDELLRQVAKVLQSQIRASDTLARLGGDEFAIILDECYQHSAVALAKRILTSIQQFYFIWCKQSFSIGVSIGVLSFQSDEDTVESVLKSGDAACYKAKSLGRNQIYVMEDKKQELAQQSQEMNWLAKINQALDTDCFHLFYQTIQPLQNDSSGSEHYEVLLRMEGKNGQIIPPMAFIPIAERYQLMNRIDRWVISTLFATQGYYYRKQAEISPQDNNSSKNFYSINLSGETLNDVNFVQFVKEEIERHQIPPQFICFEITESVAISNLSSARLMINQLRALGCSFALDDFGSGMSSFAYLKSLPVDFLKIDGIFIRELLEDPVNKAIVRSFHQVAQEMGIATIAEFVDSEEKLLKLQSLGIDYAQGYWLGKPQPFAKPKLLTSNQEITQAI